MRRRRGELRRERDAERVGFFVEFDIAVGFFFVFVDDEAVGLETAGVGCASGACAAARHNPAVHTCTRTSAKRKNLRRPTTIFLLSPKIAAQE